MNIFLPYENNVRKSIECLDDKRLNKQIVECYQLVMSAIKEERGWQIKGHRNHPVYTFYKDNIPFLAYYGYECCREYNYRFDKWHSLISYFDNEMERQGLYCMDCDGYIEAVEIPKFTPYYMEGSIKDPNHIRTTENVGKLFRQKLIKKWQNDKYPPKWTNRGMPEFYKTFLNNKGDEK